ATLADKHGVPLVVDNTVATPILCRPFDFGAHIVIHSLTKYMGGHGTTLGGIIVDSGKFQWKDNPRFPQFNEPDPSYHGVIYSEALGEAAFIGRARVVPLRNMGAAISPFNSFLILQGIETLTLRMERHVENAQRVAEYLQGHEKVEWVNYAGLPDSPHHELAKKYTKGTPSALFKYAGCPDSARHELAKKYAYGSRSVLFSFGVKGWIECGTRFIDALEMIKRLVNIGEAKSLARHPASTTHRQLSDEELQGACV